jgi:hypothetical protein
MKKATQKWQAGAKLPSIKKKNLKSEDVFALEVVIPRNYELTYLRNYHDESGSLLKIPTTSGGNRHYYTEGYKGGRFYMEIKNNRAQDKDKYEIEGTIYKIPVIH